MQPCHETVPSNEDEMEMFSDATHTQKLRTHSLSLKEMLNGVFKWKETYLRWKSGEA